MIFYTVYCEDAMEHEIACPTLAEARETARACTGDGKIDGKITRITTPDRITRQLLCAVFNRDGYATKTEEL